MSRSRPQLRPVLVYELLKARIELSARRIEWLNGPMILHPLSVVVAVKVLSSLSIGSQVVEGR